ncbi:MAG: hypothetical protein K6T87_16190 [Roseiflexus sp.]|uniref:hypothetical protein n=1 Tax=Roseiflexus sp. TaxID=2562120 RepID=UPI0025E74FE8|nr:hypothetical protein [Roseiflexus sp.]MCL6542097.1 hypothetical protein [Roseiflexus sp.]
MAWREYFIYGINFINLNAGDGTQFVDDIIRIDSDADFEFQKLVYFATSGNIRIKILDDSVGRYLFKSSANLRDIGGNFVGTPFIWPRPYQVLAGATLTISVADASGSSNSLRLYLHGAKIRPGEPPWGVYDPTTHKIVWKKYKAVLPFTYNTDVKTIAAGGTTFARIEVDNDAHFMVQKITGYASQDILLEFKDIARGADWQNIAMHHNAILGNGQYPNVLYADRFIHRGSVVSINAQNLSGSSATFEVNLIGVKLYGSD